MVLLSMPIDYHLDLRIKNKFLQKNILPRMSGLVVEDGNDQLMVLVDNKNPMILEWHNNWLLNPGFEYQGTSHT